MNKNLLRIRYLIFDIVAALIVWVLFMIFRIVVNDGRAFQGLDDGYCLVEEACRGGGRKFGDGGGGECVELMEIEPHADENLLERYVCKCAGLQWNRQ